MVSSANSSAQLRRTMEAIAPRLSQRSSFIVEGVGTLPTMAFNLFRDGISANMIQAEGTDVPLSIKNLKFDVRNVDSGNDASLQTAAMLAYLVGDASRKIGRSFSLDWTGDDAKFSMICVHQKVTVQLESGIPLTGPAIQACRRELDKAVKHWSGKETITVDLSHFAIEANEALNAREVQATGGMGGMF